jgi:hypothetical protein
VNSIAGEDSVIDKRALALTVTAMRSPWARATLPLVELDPIRGPREIRVVMVTTVLIMELKAGGVTPVVPSAKAAR